MIIANKNATFIFGRKASVLTQFGIIAMSIFKKARKEIGETSAKKMMFDMISKAIEMVEDGGNNG